MPEQVPKLSNVPLEQKDKIGYARMVIIVMWLVIINEVIKYIILTN